MGHVVILKPWPSAEALKASKTPLLVIKVVERNEEIVYTDLLNLLSYDEELGWPANVAQTFSRVSTSRFNPAVNVDLWVDEDGIAKGLPFNNTADRFGYPAPLLGRVIITAPVNGAGETLPLNNEQLADVKRVVGF